MIARNFEELEIWQLSIDISVEIYRLKPIEDLKKDYSFMDQIRRASVSISSNIAEGFERNGKKEYLRFLKIAKASAGELRSQIILAHRLNYINDDKYIYFYKKIKIISSKIAAIMKVIETKWV